MGLGRTVRAAALALVIVLALGTRPARAEVDRVALVALPGNLEAAVRTALAPWHIELVVVASPPPGPSMPSAADRATALARDQHTAAVVWLASDGSGEALWIYDAASGRTTARRLASPEPFDDPTAAAVALTVKTLLRFSAAAPVDERYAAAIDRGPPPSPGRFALTALAALRWRDAGASEVEPRLGLGLRVRLPFLHDQLLALGQVRLGPGITLDQPTFVGHFADVDAGLGLGYEVPLGPRLAVAAELAGELHFTTIDGSLPAAGGTARASRIDPAVGAGLTWAVKVGPHLEAELVVAGSYWLRRQRYLVAGQPILDLPAVELEAGLGLAVPLE